MMRLAFGCPDLTSFVFLFGSCRREWTANIFVAEASGIDTLCAVSLASRSRALPEDTVEFLHCGEEPVVC